MKKAQLTLRVLFVAVSVVAVLAWYFATYFRPDPPFRPRVNFRYATDGQNDMIHASWKHSPADSTGFMDNKPPLGELDRVWLNSRSLSSADSREFSKIYRQIFDRMKVETDLLSQTPQRLNAGQPRVDRTIYVSAEENQAVLDIRHRYEKSVNQ